MAKYLIEGTSKNTLNKDSVKTIADFEAAILEAEVVGVPYHLAAEIEGICYRALRRKDKKADALRSGRWSYPKLSTLDDLLGIRTQAEVFQLALESFLTKGDDACTRPEGSGTRQSKAEAAKAGNVAGICNAYRTMMKKAADLETAGATDAATQIRALAEDTAVECATASNLLREVVNELKLDIEIA